MSAGAAFVPAGGGGPPPCWVPGVDANSDFSMSNFPFGVFSTPDAPEPRCGSALGDYAVDLAALAEAGIFDVPAGDGEGITFPGARDIFASSTLNEFMSKPRSVWTAVRRTLVGLFSRDGPDDRLRKNTALREKALVPLRDAIMHLPATIGGYTDFYASREHATNVGIMFRGKDNALQPNWTHLPVGYHGRASSVFVSGTEVVRPQGQLQADKGDPKKGSVYGPCRQLDFELEVAFFVGGEPNDPGVPVSMAEADERIFGFVLMNDWSARDIQKWEYVPLGPFCGKNFATSISPWVVTADALGPFRRPTSAGTQGDPAPLEYLRDPDYSSFDVTLEVRIWGEGMDEAETVTRSNFSNLYWTPRQMLAHHSVSGCSMRPGDLLASGTISGSGPGSYGSMLELCWNGTREVRLGDSGQVRKFLKDGDEVVMEGYCEKEGQGRVGFGTCTGKVLPVGSKLRPGPGNGSWVAE